MNARNAQNMVGLNIADDVQRIETMKKTAEWASKLGVTDGSRFRTLLQLGGSNRTAARVAGIVENGGSQGYRAGRLALDQAQRFGNFALTPLAAGAAFGMTGKQMQPMWDYWKDRDSIQAEERKQSQLADQEAKDLERLYAEQQAAGGAAPAAGTGTGAGPPAAGGAQVVGTSPTGGQLVFDPQMNAVIDTSNGDVYDPTTQAHIGNLSQLQGGAGQAPGAAAPAAANAEVFVDAQGMYVDPQTGLKADPKSGQVYDAQGNVVGNINQPAAA
jgi:hypothetical protein